VRVHRERFALQPLRIECDGVGHRQIEQFPANIQRASQPTAAVLEDDGDGISWFRITSEANEPGVRQLVHQLRCAGLTPDPETGDLGVLDQPGFDRVHHHRLDLIRGRCRNRFAPGRWVRSLDHVV
jgi:hypothetical protein